MTRFAKQNIIVVLLLMLFTFPVFISTSAAVYATFNSTNSTSMGQLNQDLTVTSKGCGEGYGYYADDPNPICEPLDKIGQGPPSDIAFCAALGCPYNPPAETELPTADNGDNNNNFATTPVTPTEEPAVGAQPQPQPEPDPGDGNNNQDGGEEDNQNGDSDGGDGDGNTDEEESEE